MAKNHNEVGINLDYKVIFEKFGISLLYDKYKQELETLHEEFVQLSEQGVCMLIAIPKATIHKHIYIAAPGGLKRSIFIEGKMETRDMHLIMETLTKTPEKIVNIDKIEFCIPMTYDKKGGLNPESGIKVFPFDSADPVKFKDWQQRRDDLFARIAHDMKPRTYDYGHMSL